MTTHFSTSKTLAAFARFHTSSTSSPVLDPTLSLLHLSISRHSLSLTKQSHARVHRLGLDQNPIVSTKLISAYSLCRHPLAARLVFDSFRYKNVHIWNTMVNGYAKNHLFKESFDLFSRMCLNEDFGISPDGFTLSSLSKACGDIGDLLAGEAIHCKCLRVGLLRDVVVANSVVSMYCKCGNIVGSWKVFDEMPQRNISSWNALIAGLVNFREGNGDGCVWEFIRSLRNDGLEPDAFTVSSLLPLCGGDADERCSHGRELHCYIVKNGYDVGVGSEVHLGCCLIDMYSRSNKVDGARQVFDRMESRNIFVWTAMIHGYVLNGESEEALILFREMQEKHGEEPNKVSLVSVLPACSLVAGLTSGKQIHGFAIRKELNFEPSLRNALIDMYSKCGSLNLARRVFNDHSFVKDAISWSTMISGYGLHGNGQEAVCLFGDMLQLGIKPDMITIVGVLSACSRSGLVNEGLTIYNSVVKNHGIEPTLEICACVVDMLGRSGQLKQALDFIKTMLMEPGPSVWGALLSASLLHGNSEMRDLAYNFLIQIEPENPSNFVSISNLYASSQKWDIVAELRSAMKGKQLRKLPGRSWIAINSETHSFYVADKAHAYSDMIYEMLEELLLVMKGDGNCPDSEYLT